MCINDVPDLPNRRKIRHKQPQHSLWPASHIKSIRTDNEHSWGLLLNGISGQKKLFSFVSAVKLIGMLYVLHYTRLSTDINKKNGMKSIPSLEQLLNGGHKSSQVPPTWSNTVSACGVKGPTFPIHQNDVTSAQCPPLPVCLTCGIYCNKGIKMMGGQLSLSNIASLSKTSVVSFRIPRNNLSKNSFK